MDRFMQNANILLLAFSLLLGCAAESQRLESKVCRGTRLVTADANTEPREAPAAFIEADGQVQFRDDVYGRERY